MERSRLTFFFGLLYLLHGISASCDDQNPPEFGYLVSVAAFECPTAGNGDIRACIDYSDWSLGKQCETDRQVNHVNNCPGNWDIFKKTSSFSYVDDCYIPGETRPIVTRPNAPAISCGKTIIGNTGHEPSGRGIHVFVFRALETTRYTFDFCDTIHGYDVTAHISGPEVDQYSDDEYHLCGGWSGGQNIRSPVLNVDLVKDAVYKLTVRGYYQSSANNYIPVEYNMQIHCQQSTIEFFDAGARLLVQLADADNLKKTYEDNGYEEATTITEHDGQTRSSFQDGLAKFAGELSVVMKNCVDHGECNTPERAAGFFALAEMLKTHFDQYPNLHDSAVYETTSEVLELGANTFSVGEYANTWLTLTQAAEANPFGAMSAAFSGAQVGHSLINVIRTIDPRLSTDADIETIENSVFGKIGGGSAVGGTGGAIIGALFGAAGGPPGMAAGAAIGSGLGGPIGAAIGAVWHGLSEG